MRRDIDGMDEEVRSLREAVRKLERELDEMRDEVRPLLPKPKPIPRARLGMVCMLAIVVSDRAEGSGVEPQ